MTFVVQYRHLVGHSNLLSVLPYTPDSSAAPTLRFKCPLPKKNTTIIIAANSSDMVTSIIPPAGTGSGLTRATMGNTARPVYLIESIPIVFYLC